MCRRRTRSRFEWYVGARYQESETGKPARLLPFTELVYGISDRQELTFETAGLSKDGHYGLNDSVLGTKFVFLKETERRPGIAGSFELKLPTGDESRGLGSGEFDYDLRLRAQKTWGWFTAIGNVGLHLCHRPGVWRCDDQHGECLAADASGRNIRSPSAPSCCRKSISSAAKNRADRTAWRPTSVSNTNCSTTSPSTPPSARACAKATAADRICACMSD